MFGVILTSVGGLFDEFSMLIGKAKVAAGKESIFTMGFLNLFWAMVIFLGIAIFVPGAFVFSLVSLPTFILRIVLEVAQAHVTVKAIAVASRSSFSFIRTLTIPFLLGVDVMLGYTIGMYQLIGIAVIIVIIFMLFANHGIERKGSGYTLFSSINAVATISLYKYNITHFNSVVAEQLMVMVFIMIYFFVMAHFVAHEKPLSFIRKPIFLFQSVSTGIAAGFDSFAMLFASASIILTAKRASAILWSILSGNFYFHEKHFVVKMVGFVFLAVGIVLLAL